MLPKNLKQQFLFIGIAVSVIALLFGLWSHHNTQPPKPKELVLKNGTAFPLARDVKPFELKEAQNGNVFTNAQLKGHWTMVFFGFTHCASLCPTTLTMLNQTYGQLVTADVKEMPQVLFISLDPERDSLQRIREYVTSFNKNFHGATGSEQQLDKMTNELNILFSKANPNHDENYQIDHSGTVLLFNPEGKLAALFSPPIEAKILSEDYQAIIKQAVQGAN
jgi:protein SCO1/2